MSFDWKALAKLNPIDPLKLQLWAEENSVNLPAIERIQMQLESFAKTGKPFDTVKVYPLRAEEEVETPTKAEIAAKETKPDLTGAGAILLVEDEDAVRLFSARALRAKGYKILEARTGEAALEVIDEENDNGMHNTHS